MNYSPLFGQNVVGARLDVWRVPGFTGSVKSWNANLHHASAFDFNGVGSYLASSYVGETGQFASDGLTSFIRGRVQASDPTAYFMLIGSENPGVWTYKHLDATLYVDTGSAPPAAPLVAPADGSVLVTRTPTLQVGAVTDPDGDPVKYCFRVATGADGRSGVVVESGCLTTPQWTVPAGVLQDGVAYTWQVTTVSALTSTVSPWIGHLKVDMRIGDAGPSPVDTAGTVTTNLANGNVSISASSPTFNTVGGSAGLSFSYNSQDEDNKGLRASYYSDLNHNWVIDDGVQPTLVRTEPQVNVDWANTSPHAPALPADYFIVQWNGYFQAPAAGTYLFAGVHDDKTTVWINNAQVYLGEGPSDVNWTQATGVALTAGQRVPIKVELAEVTGDARLRLFVKTSDDVTVPAQIVNPDWLYTEDLPALSTGWTLSADLDGSGGGYASAQVTDQTIVLTDATGGKHTWTKASTGGYTPPAGEDGVISLDTAGRVTLTDDGTVYAFRADGRLESQNAVVDSRRPAALQNIYDGAPVRLREIRDPVSARSHRLHYNRTGDDCYHGLTPPAGADPAPPAQMLCRIAYWDGTETLLWYTAGKLARIEDPGEEFTDFGYNGSGLVDRVRDPLVNDWVAVDLPNRGPLTEVLTAIGYDTGTGKPRATSVTLPAPAVGQPRAGRTYRYVSGTETQVDFAGLSPATGYGRTVTFDAALRQLTDTDATGRTRSQEWNVKDGVVAVIDPAGRKSTTVYDHADRPVDRYGPAAQSCFTGLLPTAACEPTVARTQTRYDEGLSGLSAAFYDNPGLIGAPKDHTTGIGTNVPAGLQLNTLVTLGVTTATDQYLRHRDGLGFTSQVNGGSDEVTKQDAEFALRSGLADATCYSFESRNYPGQYLRHADYRIRIAANDGSALFAQDATFCARTGHTAAGTSFESKNFPGRFIRRINGEVYISSNGGPNPWDSTTSWADDTTWRVAPPSWRSYVPQSADNGSLSGAYGGQIVGLAGKCLDDRYMATDDGTPMQLWTCNTTDAQRWTISGNTVRVLGKCLDVQWGATGNGTPVWLWTCNGGGAQNWIMQSNGTLINPQSNKCLDVSGWGTADGTPMVIWDCHGGTNQRWTLPANQGAPRPGVPSVGWSARFSGEIQLPEAGAYTFGFNVVDGVRLWVDDTLVVDGWADHPVTTSVTGTYTNTVAGQLAPRPGGLLQPRRQRPAELHLDPARPDLAGGGGSVPAPPLRADHVADEVRVRRRAGQRDRHPVHRRRVGRGLRPGDGRRPRPDRAGVDLVVGVRGARRGLPAADVEDDAHRRADRVDPLRGHRDPRQPLHAGRGSGQPGRHGQIVHRPVAGRRPGPGGAGGLRRLRPGGRRGRRFGVVLHDVRRPRPGHHEGVPGPRRGAGPDGHVQLCGGRGSADQVGVRSTWDGHHEGGSPRAGRLLHRRARHPHRHDLQPAGAGHPGDDQLREPARRLDHDDLHP